MATSQNGYTAPPPGGPQVWHIPARNGAVTLTIRGGAVGFVLAHLALWYAECIEPLFGKIVDDWGYAWRPIRGQVTGLSNHSSATAVDFNATRHPIGKRGTVKAWLRTRIAVRLRVVYRGVIRSGIFYHTRADEMHYEINTDLPAVVALAKRLTKTKRGQRIMAANNLTAAQACEGWPV